MKDLTRLHKGIKQLAAYGMLAGLMLGFILLTAPVQDSGLMIGQEASAETIQSSVQEQRHPLPSTLQTSAASSMRIRSKRSTLQQSCPR